MQHLIGLKSPFVAGYIKDALTGFFIAMSKLKDASVVVKKLMEAADGKYASEITNYIIESPHFLSVLLDPYGFEVLQCALKYSKVPITMLIFFFFIYCLARASSINNI